MPTKAPLHLHFHFLVPLTSLLVLMDQNASPSLTFAMDGNGNGMIMASSGFAMTDHTHWPLNVIIALKATYSSVPEMGWILV